MNDTLDPLVLDLIEWVEKEPRTYSQVIDAWRTSCPRLTVWEDAVDRGFITREPKAGQSAMVLASAQGREFLKANGRVVSGSRN